MFSLVAAAVTVENEHLLRWEISMCSRNAWDEDNDDAAGGEAYRQGNANRLEQRRRSVRIAMLAEEIARMRKEIATVREEIAGDEAELQRLKGTTRILVKAIRISWYLFLLILLLFAFLNTFYQ